MGGVPTQDLNLAQHVQCVGMPTPFSYTSVHQRKGVIVPPFMPPDYFQGEPWHQSQSPAIDCIEPQISRSSVRIGSINQPDCQVAAPVKRKLVKDSIVRNDNRRVFRTAKQRCNRPDLLQVGDLPLI